MEDLCRLSYVSLSPTNNSCGAVHEISWLPCSPCTTVIKIMLLIFVKAYFQLLRVNWEGRNYLLILRDTKPWSLEVLSICYSYIPAGIRNLDISVRDQYPFALRDWCPHLSQEKIDIIHRNLNCSSQKCHFLQCLLQIKAKDTSLVSLEQRRILGIWHQDLNPLRI